MNPSTHRNLDAHSLRLRWLGSFLRAKRESLQPADVGLPTTHRRRTPGLRREEVASLANVGVTWYTWLEQGRDISVSTSVLEAIATALNLRGQELEHLFALAGRFVQHQTAADDRLATLLGRLLHAASGTPAYIADRYWNIVDVNPLGSYIFGLESGSNCLFKFFTDAQYASRYPFRESAGRMMVTQFRQKAIAHPTDPTFQLIVEELAEVSAEFTSIWKRHEIDDTPHIEVVYDHPGLGRLTFDSVLLTPVGTIDLTLYSYVPDENAALAIERVM